MAARVCIQSHRWSTALLLHSRCVGALRNARLRRAGSDLGGPAGQRRCAANERGGHQIDAHAQSAAWAGACRFVADRLDRLGAAYCFRGATAAWLQGAHIQPVEVHAEVQWDFLEGLHSSLEPGSVVATGGPPQAVPGGRELRFTWQGAGPAPGVLVRLTGDTAAVVATHPERIALPLAASAAAGAPPRPGRPAPPPTSAVLWVASLLSVRSGAEAGHTRGGSPAEGGAPQLAAAASARLAEMQVELSAHNAQAWAGADTYASWVGRFGSPGEAAPRIARDPAARLAPLHRLLPADPAGLRAANLLASHGTKAVALALLGARVTAVDISPGNARYAGELAAAAGVPLRYVVADVLSLPAPDVPAASFDLVLMELGVLHYFLDLRPLLAAVAALLAPGGTLLLRDFHPVSTKLVETMGKRRRQRGSYFSQDLVGTSAAHAKYAPGGGGAADSATAAAGGGGGGTADAPPGVRLRQWALGEVVTAAAQAGLRVEALVEEPGPRLDDAGVPKLFTLVARRDA